MKGWIKGELFILLLLAWAEGACATSDHSKQDLRYSYPLEPVHAQIRVEGSSTLGHWDCTQNAIDGRAGLSVSLGALREQINMLLSGGLVGASKETWSQLESQVEVSIGASGFDCHSGRMQRDLAVAIRAEKYPSINYSFSRVEGVPVLLQDEDGPYVELKLGGKLFFGGALRPIVHTTQLRLSGTSTIEVKGILDLEMTAFDIEPPTAFFGLIHANDDFKVGYHLKIRTEKMVAYKEQVIRVLSTNEIR